MKPDKDSHEAQPLQPSTSTSDLGQKRVVVVSPYAAALTANPETTNLGISPPSIGFPAESAPETPYRKLDVWGLAALGMINVLNTGVVEPPPAGPGTSLVGTMPGSMRHSAQASSTLPHDDVVKAVTHVAASKAAAPTENVTTTMTPTQKQLVIHISQGVDAEADQTVEILVQVQQQKPSESDVKNAKDFFQRLHRDVLGYFSDPSKLAEHLGSRLLEAGEHYGWIVLELIRKRSKKAAKSNPILSRLADAYEKLSRIYAPKAYSISYLAKQLNCSEEEAVAILKSGPFIESAPGIWEIDQHFGERPSSLSEH